MSILLGMFKLITIEVVVMNPWSVKLKLHGLYLENASWMFSADFQPPLHSLLTSPQSYIIPGSRFREVYYWNSYWVIKGLFASQMHGIRTATISDSDGNRHNLSGCYAMWTKPSPESFTSDKETTSNLSSVANKELLYQDMISTVESGWDFSTRQMRHAYDIGVYVTIWIFDPGGIECIKSLTDAMFDCVVKLTLLLVILVFDPAQALSSILRQWGKPANTEQWNTTGDPCSGKAIDESADLNDPQYNPFIKCDCTFDDNTTCHITQMKVYAIDALGVLPDDLWKLVYLTNLDVRQNYLTGQIPSGVGNLTRMQYLSFGTNALSGPIPKELGKLTALKSLSFSSNNFSGPLPSELGNLENLQQLYISSSGVSGPIPSTFANLKNLQTLWASDTELTGAIPSYIGNWSQLEVLRLEGTSLMGPIPSTFSNLASLTQLRISGLSNSSSSLGFVTNLTSLEILSLKNNGITGPIPSSIGQLQNLNFLDLSFNSLTGQIPDSVFSLVSLIYLFVGKNKLTGDLPSQKSPSLLNIDVSYNQLSGVFPSWISESNLQINLVANNFSDASSNNRALPSGLNCVQNGFPCNGGLGRYSDFAIKCGGPMIKMSNQVLYEKDDETLGPATYFVSGDKWAVSNTGIFTSNNNASYTFNSPRQFTSLDSELFQTTRLSAGSLRYYGLGLQNGNYSVLLQFVELQFENGKTWKSLGRRVFDIYIQGNRVETNFDIRKAAAGKSFVPVQRNYTVQVKANYIEVHLFWAGKGTCCIPSQGTYGPSISALSATPLFQPRPVPSENSNRAALVVGLVVSAVLIALLSFGGWWCFQRNKRLRAAKQELLGIDAKIYSFGELRSATGDFNSSNKLGEGGFGAVFKGTLSDGRIVAVKRLSVVSHQGKDQFIAEIAAISSVQHRNLVKLYGCCIEREKRLLVYEYMEKKNLDQALFGDSSMNLNWTKWFEICLGVARGLTYLHEDASVRIVQTSRRVISCWMLIITPKFQILVWPSYMMTKKKHLSTRVAGTIGYLAPEYAMRGHLTEKVDVFGFGVVALDLVSGRPNTDSTVGREQMYLLDWAWHLHENNQDIDLLDKKLTEFNDEEVKRVIIVGLLCTQTAPGHRPSMSRALAMLSGDIEVGTITSKPTYLADWNFDDPSLTRVAPINLNTETLFLQVEALVHTLLTRLKLLYIPLIKKGCRIHECSMQMPYFK